MTCNSPLHQQVSQRYLQRFGLQGPWCLEGTIAASWRGAVIIPSLAEGNFLKQTLKALDSQQLNRSTDWIIVVVVNATDSASPEVLQQNRSDLEWLRSHRLSRLGVAWVDAGSAGLRLPVKRGGVGMARKIGCDLVLPYLRPDGLLVHLDADCRVEPSYLETIDHYFADHAGGAVVPYCHPLPQTAPQREAMIAYELYLRCHRYGLQRAASPYAYHAIGSTMATTAAAYVKAGGMNCRQAGEDFYFLQQVAKTSGIGMIQGTLVWPSSRISQRTPFGTGQVIAAGTSAARQKLYHPQTYAVIGDWLHAVINHPREIAAQLLDRACAIDPELQAFLVAEGFAGRWLQLCDTHEAIERRLRAFHEWFDGLKTLRCIHALGHKYPAAPAQEQVPRLFEAWGWPPCSGVEEALSRLRRQDLPWLPDSHAALTW